MYLCTKFYPTVAVGVRCDPVEFAMRLPFRHPDGRLATPEEIRAEYNLVAQRKDLARRGGWTFQAITKLRLTQEGMQALTMRKLEEMATALRARFGQAWDDAPADAQLGTLCLAWAAGAGFRFPKFDAAFRRGDWTVCARECHLDEDGEDNIRGTYDDNAGVAPRNRGMEVMFRNAAHVVARELDRNVLDWPGTLATEDAPTLPQLPASEPVLEIDGGLARRAMMSDALKRE
jgi:hypothetical protein